MIAIASLDICRLEPAAWLAIVGGILEISGFSLVAVELARAQRRELGTAGPFQFVVVFGQWVKRLYRRVTGKSIVHEASAHLSGIGTVTGRLSARTGTESEELDERMRVLEENFRQLDAEVTQHRSQLDAKIDKESEAHRKALAAFETRVQAQEAEARKAFATSAALQWWGIGLFVLGALTSAAANVVGAS